MAFKLNIAHNNKTWKLETDTKFLIGKSLGDKINGKEIKAELDGYELELTGGSDIAGFPMSKNIEGIGLRKSLLRLGWGMHKKPKKEGKKKVSTVKGLRLKKTLRGRTISENVIQINMKVVKEGKKPLTEIFPEQNQPKQVKPVKQAA